MSDQGGEEYRGPAAGGEYGMGGTPPPSQPGAGNGMYGPPSGGHARGHRAQYDQTPHGPAPPQSGGPGWGLGPRGGHPPAGYYGQPGPMPGPHHHPGSYDAGYGNPHHHPRAGPHHGYYGHDPYEGYHGYGPQPPHHTGAAQHRNGDLTGSRDGEQRMGHWTHEEEFYAEKVKELFKLGKIPNCPEEITLRSLLSKLLNCTPMRVSKKYAKEKALGKCVYRHVGGDDMAAVEEELKHCEKEFHRSLGGVRRLRFCIFETPKLVTLIEEANIQDPAAVGYSSHLHAAAPDDPRAAHYYARAQPAHYGSAPPGWHPTAGPYYQGGGVAHGPSLHGGGVNGHPGRHASAHYGHAGGPVVSGPSGYCAGGPPMGGPQNAPPGNPGRRDGPPPPAPPPGAAPGGGPVQNGRVAQAGPATQGQPDYAGTYYAKPHVNAYPSASNGGDGRDYWGRAPPEAGYRHEYYAQSPNHAGPPGPGTGPPSGPLGGPQGHGAPQVQAGYPSPHHPPPCAMPGGSVHPHSSAAALHHASMPPQHSLAAPTSPVTGPQHGYDGGPPAETPPQAAH